MTDNWKEYKKKQGKYFDKNSSSLHILSGDKKLNLFEKILWLIFNFINNYFNKSFIDKNLENCVYNPKKELFFSFHNSKNSSPSRILCNQFLIDMDLKRITRNFDKIKILEIGCGRGHQIEIFDEIFGENYSYLGIDPHRSENWDRLSSEKIKFSEDTYLNLNKYFNDCNIILSQSVLEHLDQDMLLFKNISDHVNSSKKKIINIHFFPSVACYYTYRGHGIRQYQKHTISKLTKYFSKNTKKQIYYLGSDNLNKLHKKKFGRGIFFNQDNISDHDYYEEIKKNLKGNNFTLKEPSFYGLCLMSNLESL